MQNAEIADRLDAFASLLELAEANPYTARAYRRAAETIRGAPLPVAELVQAGRVRELRGIGPGIEARLRELVETGEIAELTELERELAPGLVGLGRYLGLGARRALEIARALGLVIEERRETEPARYAAMLAVRVGGTEVSGTLVQGEPRIVLIDGFWVDVPVEGHLLLTKHQDKPGLVGRVGTLLGEHDVNISSMQVGRLHPRGEALMILTLDDPVPDEVRARIGAFADVDRVRTARLGVSG